MKRILAALMCALMVLTMMAGCTQDQATTTPPAENKVEAPASDVAMQYKTVDEAEALLNDDSYVFFDVRKAADSSAATIPGALAYDMDAAKEGNFEAGVATMTPAIKDLDKNIILVCYSGKRYAQATTNVLSALGYDMSKVYTLEGGFTAWSEAGKATSAPEEAPAKIEAPASDVAMQYITVDDAEKVLNDDSYVFFDVRKAADSAKATIPGALAYDMDAAKEGDFEAGVKVMQDATKDLDKNLVIVCYSGKRYAQATTNVLSALGYDMSKVYTLEGGFTAWNKANKEVLIADDIKAPETDVAMQYISVADAAKVLGDENYVFFDVRKAADSSAATIPGAAAHDMDAAKEGDFAHGVATMQLATRGLDKNIVIICYSGKSYAQATTNALSALGYDMSKVYTLEGGFKAWSEAFKDDVAMNYIAPADALAVLEDDSYVFFDVRKADDHKAGHIKGSLSYDMDAAKEGDFNAGLATMLEATKDLDKNVVVICYSGKRYAQATTNALSALGYDMSKVFTLEGGMKAWTDAGYATEA